MMDVEPRSGNLRLSGFDVDEVEAKAAELQACSFATTSPFPATGLRPHLQARLRGDRVEATGLALPAGPNQMPGLDQGEEPGGAGGAA